MKVQMKKVVNVDVRTVCIHLKVSDAFSYSLIDDCGEEVFTQEDGYVPSFMPGEHYGDYVILDIDVDTGKIINWRAPETILESLNQILKNKSE